ncbi:MAG: NAD-dependent deacylase [Bacteroidota bacterium]
MKRVVVLTGAGISAESGLKTFRGAGGLWEGHPVQEVASPQGFAANPSMVLRFYNERRAQLKEVEPNDGHLALVELEKAYQVDIITQNVDNLHERAGSSHILHLHGELTKARSVTDESYVVECEGDIEMGDTAPDGGQMRPHIVWFGEAVPMIEKAVEITLQADFFIVVGTSLVVYPAAGLVDFVPQHSPIFIVDPHKPPIQPQPNLEFIVESATVGVPQLVQRLLEEA